MTPGEVIEYARQQYNAINDTFFFTDEEMYRYVWEAEMQLAKQAYVIKSAYTASTVASQQEYSLPSNTLTVKRVTYAGKKLKPISFREDDTITIHNAATTATGEPSYYAFWNETLYLRPVPNAVGTLKVFSFNEPAEVSSTSVLEIPTRYHQGLVDFLISKMAAKDKNFEAASYYMNIWQKTVKEARDHERKHYRGDAFSAVQDFEMLEENYLGIV
jgi:hypothetical protein